MPFYQYSPTHLGEDPELINQIRKSPVSKNLKIAVGGYPFKIAKNLWRQVGADCCATDAEDAVSVVNNLFRD